MTNTDLDAFERARASGRDVRIRAGETIHYATPVEATEIHFVVRMRGTRERRAWRREHIAEIRIAGETKEHR